MLGNIIEVSDNIVKIKLQIDLDTVPNLVNNYVIFDDDKKIVGEIIKIKEDIAYVNLLGQIINKKFVFGVIVKPPFKSKVKIISEEKVSYIIGMEQYDEKKDLYLGKSPIYEDVSIGVKIDTFFNNHFAIFGSTGSGKSCSVARILQNLLEKEGVIPYRSNIFLFDPYGEYYNAFHNINKKALDINYKLYTTDLKATKSSILRIPLWLLTVDDIAILLEIKKSSQLAVIEKALKFVTVFNSNNEEMIKQKNSIIASAIMNILTSGKTPVQIRDQIFSILTCYNTPQLNLDTEIIEPGYIRKLKQCIMIDNTGKIREIEMLMKFFNSFIDNSIELKLPDGSFKYTLEELKDGLEFALISEGILKSDKVYDEYNFIKLKLDNLIKSEYSEYFKCEEYETVEQFICNLLITKEKKKAQLVNFNLNYVDDRFGKIITKIFSKILFDYARKLKKKASFPIHIILEEAHRFAQKDNDNEIIGYNIFERIAKEGRKYAVIMGFISQRPKEISETCLSQCQNFLVFKLLHLNDLKFITEIIPNVNEKQVEKFKILPPGTCMAFGNAFKMPVFIKFEMPVPAPNSGNAKISDIWFIDKI